MPPKKRRQSIDAGSEASASSTPIPKRRRKGVQYDPGELCQEVYEAIRSHKTEDGRLLCETFLRVPKRRNEPEYYDIISQPIDLMKVQNKLKTEEYDDLDQMKEDIELIVSNTKKYYSETAVEYSDAVALLQLFEEVKTVVLSKKFTVDEPSESSTARKEIDQESMSSSTQFTYMDESTNDVLLDDDDTVLDDDGDDDDLETDDKVGSKNEDSNAMPKQKKPRKRKKRRGREVTSSDIPNTDDDSCSKPPTRMSLREKEPQDFSSLVGARRGRPPKEGSVTREDKDGDQASSVGDDDNSAYEELLSSIVSAKEGDRVICEMFKVLPHKQALPAYYDIIKEPIDLKMIAQKIQRNEYTCTDEMFKDLILMVNNARSFNVPGSQIYKDAAALRRLIVEKKIESGQPKVVRPTRRTRRGGQKEKISVVLAALEYDPFPAPVAETLTQETSSMLGDTAEELSEAEDSIADEGESQNPLWSLYSTVKSFKDPMGQSLCDPFVRLPNRRFYPDYYEEIKKPITLPKIKRRIVIGQYKTLDAVHAALDLLFENAKRYNVEGSKIHADAATLQAIMKTKYKELAIKDDFLCDGSSEVVQATVPPVVIVKKSRKSFETQSVTSEEGGGSPKRKPGRKPIGDDPFKRRLWTLYRTIFEYQSEGRVLCNAFLALPSKKSYQDYYQVISEPIDMTMIENKIRENRYFSDQSLIQDLELMLHNARNYNENKSQIYNDAETLEKILRAKIKSLPPLDGSPMMAGKACRKVYPDFAQVQRFHDLFSYIRDFSDKGRILSTPFMKLPPKQDYPDYYEIIKKPMDMMRINQRISSNQYASLEDMVSDFVQIFDNACKYNEPDSLIYKDALRLQRACLEKKQEMIPQEDGSVVPDVRALVQEMMTNLYTSTYNHVDEEGRCYSDSFQELPFLIDEELATDGQKSIKNKPSFQQVKRNLDRGRYRRVDKFQEDMIEVFEYGRRVSRSDSQLYEDAVELELYFMRQRDEICKNGESLITPALSYTEQMLNLAVDTERKGKQEKEQKEEEERRRREESKEKDDRGEEKGEDSLIYNGHTYNLGDFVKIEPREPSLEYQVVVIERMLKDEKGEPLFQGNFFFQPQETFHTASRKFLQKELFKSDKTDMIPFSKITGFCYVMSVRDYFKYKPTGFHENDVFICESRYSIKMRVFKKIKIWSIPKNENVKIVPREVPLVPVRIRSVFAEKSETLDTEPEESSILDKDREVVIMENYQGSEDGNIYYQQLQVAAGWFKIGDFAYVQQMGVKTVITRIDKMWTNNAGDAFIYGPTYVHPYETEHPPTRTFYQLEVFKTQYEDTHWMDNILGRCVCMPYKDYVSCRLTEIPEKDVYICEAKYIEAEKQIKKFMKPTSMINPNSLSIRVCDDEVYFFKKQITPQKVPSPLLMDMMQQQQQQPTFAMDESAMHAFDENSSQLDGSFSESFNMPVSFGELELSTQSVTPETTGTGRKRKGAKKGNVSGYIMFAAEVRKDIVKSHKELSFGEVSKMVGQKWKMLEKDQKEIYEAQAVIKQAELKAKHAAAERAFNMSMQNIQQAASPGMDSKSPQVSKQYVPSPQPPPGMQGYSPMATQGYTQGALPPQGYMPQGYQQQPQQLGQMQPQTVQMQQQQPGMVGQPQQPQQMLQPQAVVQQQMGPPPTRPPSPMFVSVPPRTQRLLHSEAYLKYIENLRPDRQEVSNWVKQYTATEDNTAVSGNTKLPIHWLGNGVGHHENVTSALWALRDLMMKDTLSMSRTLQMSEF